MHTNFLPNRILKEANIGWETAEANRKLLPVQNASMDVPSSSEAMVGRAKARHAASSETHTLTTISEPNANLKALEGRHSFPTAKNKASVDSHSRNYQWEWPRTLAFFLDRCTDGLLRQALLQSSQP